MMVQSMTQVENAAATRRFLPVLLLLFVGSGCAALIYEIVWFQLLELVIGSSAVSLGVLLGTFMGGMCLGSLLLPRFVSAKRHPLFVYAVIELGIGVCGFLVLTGMPLVSRVYSATVGHGMPGIFLRAAICALFLLPPTLLMGASLPAIARWVETTPRGVSWLGFFYGGNTIGAVFGCLLAGFYLLRVYDMPTATFVAISINAAVAILSATLVGLAPYRESAGDPEENRSTGAPGAWPVYVTIALSGLCALGAEVVWTRVLSLMLGATVYTFSIILAVFLAGLGIGSGVGSMLAREISKPRLALGLCQALLAGATAWTAMVLARSLPWWPVNTTLATSQWFNFQLDLARCMYAILPPALLWGASFPLALAAVASRRQDPGRVVGRVYAANTVGAIIGSLAFAMILIPLVGTQNSQRILIGLSAVAALVILAALIRRANAVIAVGSVVALAGLAAGLIYGVAKVPFEAVAYGRRMVTSVGYSTLMYVGEGMNASVAVTRWNDGARMFHVSGKVEASSEPYDMRLQRMLGHIPALLHPNPRSVLVVGCGAGVTAGSFMLYPEVQKLVLVEIESLIPKIADRYFSEENHGVLKDPRTSIVIDDARNYVLTTQEKFDIITSDPIHPWVKGAATLYSKEYFELVKQHLNPGGLVTQWVPLYESTPDTVRSEIATFFEVFPYGTLWSNDMSGEGYDILLLGQVEPPKINLDVVQERLSDPAHARVAAALEEVQFHSAVNLLATYAGRRADLAPWLKGALINRDRNLRLQYIAGMGLNSVRAVEIFNWMVQYRRFPEDVFVGSVDRRGQLRMALGLP
jgi:spermidine synthase